jgi:hypothetical protein
VAMPVDGSPPRSVTAVAMSPEPADQRISPTAQGRRCPRSTRADRQLPPPRGGFNVSGTVSKTLSLLPQAHPTLIGPMFLINTEATN